MEEQGTPLTPLLEAAKRRDYATVEILLRNNVDNVDAADTQGKTALCYAAINGDVRMFEMLLGAGADVNVRCFDGSTPLILATQYVKPKIVTILIKEEADVNAADNEGYNPLIMAVVQSSAKLVI